MYGGVRRVAGAAGMRKIAGAGSVQARGVFKATAPVLDKHYKQEEWNPLNYTVNNGGRSLINKDTTLYEFMMYQYRLNRMAGTVDDRIGRFVETVYKNMGYVSLRSKASNYSVFYYYGLMNRMTSGLLYNTRLQPVMMHKVNHLLAYFHGGHTQQHRSIMRKPVNFKYFWLWWQTRRMMCQAHQQYDEWVYKRQCADGTINLPPMKTTTLRWRKSLMNCFDSSSSTL